MGDKELNQLIERVAIEEAAEAAEEIRQEEETERAGSDEFEINDGDVPRDDMPPIDAMTAMLCKGLVTALGQVVTARVKVSPLSGDETTAVGMALAQVVACYDIGKLDPKWAAWIGLGGSLLIVSAPRLEEYAKTIDGEAEEIDEEVEGEFASAE